ncbi:hypothetical protein AU255_04940 [Methyloprofundus sedimenti]|uniref:Uncharacterized protein n=1 Tax=Methyloprofundus sedimenti TaxID=1420851 RepID=A0A1V8M6M1_9GAMM|nr:hypothetical protein [Methyloprofundus sedimenti]OQK17240.1 hypothetical protein AU255_04940 [Methyloprofundus sedimenti]
MNQQKKSNIVQYWADSHLVVSGNQYQLIDNETQKILFKCTAKSDLEASKKCCAFLRYGNAKQPNKFKLHKAPSNVMSLPFVTKSKAGRDWFNIPVTGDYAIDCSTGVDCAAMLIKAMRDDKGYCGGNLQLIVLSLLNRKETKQELHGIIVGFFSQLDVWLQLSATHGGKGLDNISYEQFIEKVSSCLKEVA